MTHISRIQYWQTFLVLANSLHFFFSFFKRFFIHFFLLDLTNHCWDYRKITITLALSSGLIRFTPKPYGCFFTEIIHCVCKKPKLCMISYTLNLIKSIYVVVFFCLTQGLVTNFLSSNNNQGCMRPIGSNFINNFF